jgi:glucose-1-phosphate cytidylyltransferase
VKVVILAGGLGTRLSEETQVRPKPMAEIGDRPLLWHIMKIYGHYGLTDFVVCLGYKGYVIKEYFANYFLHNSNVTFDLRGARHGGPRRRGRAMARHARRHRLRHADRRAREARRRAISVTRPSC